MARRQDSGDNDVSLFPFLSILACIIGVLTLMISTLALSQMDTKAVAAAEEFEKVEDELEKKQASVKELKQQFESQMEQIDQAASKEQKELNELQKKLEDILAQYLLAQKKAKEIVNKNPEEDSELQQQPIDELKKELTANEEEVAQLTRSIEEKKLPPEEAEFSVLPGGSGIGVIPRFIECTKTDLVLHNPNGLIRVRAGGMETDKNYLKLLNEVAGKEEAKVIFLVRDDGVHVYYRAKRFSDTLEVPSGKLPVLGHGRINLKNFHRNSP